MEGIKHVCLLIRQIQLEIKWGKVLMLIRIYQQIYFIDMHNFEEYMRREILTLVSRQKPLTTSARTSITKISSQDTPYSSSVNKNSNTYWKTSVRVRLKINENKTKNAGIHHRASTGSLRVEKQAFYGNMLKAEKRLNEREAALQVRKRKDTQETNSTHRRLCLDSHMQLQKIEDMANLQLIKRQSSTGSDIYLKAKLQHSKRRPPSSSQLLKIIKI